MAGSLASARVPARRGIRRSSSRIRQCGRNGSWTLKELPDGSTEALYAVEVKVAAFVPKSVSSRIVGQTVPALLASFKSRAEQRFSV